MKKCFKFWLFKEAHWQGEMFNTCGSWNLINCQCSDISKCSLAWKDTLGPESSFSAWIFFFMQDFCFDLFPLVWASSQESSNYCNTKRSIDFVLKKTLLKDAEAHKLGSCRIHLLIWMTVSLPIRCAITYALWRHSFIVSSKSKTVTP